MASCEFDLIFVSQLKRESTTGLVWWIIWSLKSLRWLLIFVVVRNMEHNIIIGSSRSFITVLCCLTEVVGVLSGSLTVQFALVTIHAMCFVLVFCSQHTNPLI